MDNLKEELQQLVFQLGGDLFGVAGFDDVADKIAQEYGDTYKDFDRAISIAVFFPKTVLNELADGPTHTYLYYYDVINARLNDIALRVSNYLQKKGFI
jgi:epoxyqueuosine reductase QueG